MGSPIHRRVTFVNVALTIALVFAMTGGAYAASKYLITSIKQISPKVLKSLQGKAGKAGVQGPQGPQGLAGPAGTNGKNGTPGSNGGNGSNGESVTAKIVAVTDKSKCGGLGGVEYTLAGKATLICNGQTGFTETLPTGKTETGAWAATGPEAQAAISFPIPLSASLSSSHVHLAQASTAAECPGTVEKPEATEGNLCVYQSTGPPPTDIVFIANPATLAPGAAASGADLITSLTVSAKELVHGTFAVTAG
jgi:hypothetical protein